MGNDGDKECVGNDGDKGCVGNDGDKGGEDKEAMIIKDGDKVIESNDNKSE